MKYTVDISINGSTFVMTNLDCQFGSLGRETLPLSDWPVGMWVPSLGRWVCTV